MPVVTLDGSSVRDFVEDVSAFSAAMDARFRQFDVDRDGSLSRAELRQALELMRLRQCSLGVPEPMEPQELDSLYDLLFQIFDADGDGSVSPSEFSHQMRLILLAVARGLGAAPVHVVIDHADALLQDAVSHQCRCSC